MEVLRRHQYSAFGPGEPKGFAKLRKEYHARQQQIERREVRIMLTDAGLEWLMRVKQIGKRRP